MRLKLIASAYFLLLFLSGSFAQKLKTDGMDVNLEFFPEQDLPPEYKTIEYKVINNNTKVAVHHDTLLKWQNSVPSFRNLTRINGGADLILTIQLENDVPSTTSFPDQYAYLLKSLVTLKDKMGRVLFSKKTNNNYQVTSKPVFNSLAYHRNLFLEAVEATNSVRYKYDYMVENYSISLLWIKGEGFEKWDELDGNIQKYFKQNVVRPFRGGIRKNTEEMFVYLEEMIKNKKKEEKDDRNILAAAWFDLAYLNAFDGNIPLAEEYLSKADSLDIKNSGVKRCRTVIADLKSNKARYDKNVISEAEKPVAGNSLVGFVVIGSDTIVGEFLNAQSSARRNFITVISNGKKMNFESERVRYFYADEILFKSLPPFKKQDGLLVGKEFNDYNRNQFYAVMYESDSCLFLLELDKSKLWLHNKTNGKWNDIPYPSENRVIFVKSLRKAYAETFSTCPKFVKAIEEEQYKFNEKNFKEMLYAIKEFETMSSGDPQKFDRCIDRILYTTLNPVVQRLIKQSK